MRRSGLPGIPLMTAFAMFGRRDRERPGREGRRRRTPATAFNPSVFVLAAATAATCKHRIEGITRECAQSTVSSAKRTRPRVLREIAAVRRRVLATCAFDSAFSRVATVEARRFTRFYLDCRRAGENRCRGT
jgi:hypothetical protein